MWNCFANIIEKVSIWFLNMKLHIKMTFCPLASLDARVILFLNWLFCLIFVIGRMYMCRLSVTEATTIGQFLISLDQLKLRIISWEENFKMKSVLFHDVAFSFFSSFSTTLWDFEWEEATKREYLSVTCSAAIFPPIQSGGSRPAHLLVKSTLPLPPPPIPPLSKNPPFLLWQGGFYIYRTVSSMPISRGQKSALVQGFSQSMSEVIRINSSLKPDSGPKWEKHWSKCAPTHTFVPLLQTWCQLFLHSYHIFT